MECSVQHSYDRLIKRANRICKPILRFGAMVVMALLLCGLTSCGEKVEVPINLSNIPYEDIAPRWSHNGKFICFIRQYENGFMRLYLTDASLSKATPLTPPFELDRNREFRPDYAQWMAREGPAWSANDQSIAYQVGNWNKIGGEKVRCVNLYRVSLSGDLNTPLALHGHDFKGTLTYYRSIAFSPDGRHFAFMGDGKQDESDMFLREFPITNPDDATPLYDRYADTDFPSWSPNGNRLAYRQGVLRSLTCKKMEELYVVPVSYAKFQRFSIPDGLPHRIVGITWNPNGKSILLTLANDPLNARSYSLWIVTLSTGKFKRVSPADNSGYFGCAFLASNIIGALRKSHENIEAVAINPRNEKVSNICNVKTPDVDWSAKNSALVWASPGKMNHTVKLSVKVFKNTH